MKTIARRNVLLLVLTVHVAIIMALTLGLFKGPAPPEIFTAVMAIAAPQLIYHTITLWPLWLCGYIGQRGHADTGPRETAPASGNPFAQ